MNIFVTGATGLLGGNIVKALLERNHNVTALVRSIEKGLKIMDADVTLVEGDLLDIAFMATLKGRITGKPPSLKPRIIKRLLVNFGFDSSKASKELGIHFRPLSVTLADTAGWFQQI